MERILLKRLYFLHLSLQHWIVLCRSNAGYIETSRQTWNAASNECFRWSGQSFLSMADTRRRMKDRKEKENVWFNDKVKLDLVTAQGHVTQSSDQPLKLTHYKGDCLLVREQKIQSLSCTKRRGYLYYGGAEKHEILCHNGTVTWEDASAACVPTNSCVTNITQAVSAGCDDNNRGYWLGLKIRRRYYRVIGETDKDDHITKGTEKLYEPTSESKCTFHVDNSVLCGVIMSANLLCSFVYCRGNNFGYCLKPISGRKSNESHSELAEGARARIIITASTVCSSLVLLALITSVTCVVYFMYLKKRNNGMNSPETNLTTGARYHGGSAGLTGDQGAAAFSNGPAICGDNDSTVLRVHNCWKKNKTNGIFNKDMRYPVTEPVLNNASTGKTDFEIRGTPCQIHSFFQKTFTSRQMGLPSRWISEEEINGRHEACHLNGPCWSNDENPIYYSSVDDQSLETGSSAHCHSLPCRSGRMSASGYQPYGPYSIPYAKINDAIRDRSDEDPKLAPCTMHKDDTNQEAPRVHVVYSRPCKDGRSSLYDSVECMDTAPTLK